jgi:single-stranded DNA-binding protein
MIKLIVSGRVGQDAELKSVGDTTVCSFSVAHTEKVYGPNPKEPRFGLVVQFGEKELLNLRHSLQRALT